MNLHFPLKSDGNLKEIWLDLMKVLENKFGKESISVYFDSCDNTFPAIDPETRNMIEVKGGRGWMENAIKSMIHSGDETDKQVNMDARLQRAQACHRSALSMAVKKMRQVDLENLIPAIEKIESFINAHFPIEINEVLGVGLLELAFGKIGEGLVQLAFGRIEPEKGILFCALMVIEILVIEPEVASWRDTWREMTRSRPTG